MKLLPLSLPVFAFLLLAVASAPAQVRVRQNFDAGWRFYPGDRAEAREPAFDDSAWRPLDLPHDWSIEGAFSKDHPATFNGGALPGGTGWYRKSFALPATARGRRIYLEFDGVYRCSDVWINGHHLGFRPNGYVSFRYDLTPYVRLGAGQPNVVAVRVDNSQQPNSRWYSGSGIYRHVWLLTTSDLAVDEWGTFITTPRVSGTTAAVAVRTTVRSHRDRPARVTVRTRFYSPAGGLVNTVSSPLDVPAGGGAELVQSASLARPALWSTEQPRLYKAVTTVSVGGRTVDEYTTPFGIRTIHFDADSGFYLNDRRLRLYGVNQHHDLGALGAAVNTRAMQRQLEMLKEMGCNAIRTSHNPPAPEWLDLCDRMGFVVIDEAFDMWKRPKTKFDYHLYWDEWHERDLRDQIRRDRNHPSVVTWSVGNEIPEQWDRTGPSNPGAEPDTSGAVILRELIAIVRTLDTTRAITAATDQIHPGNVLLKSGLLDLIGYNYRHHLWKDVPRQWGRKPFIGSETASAFETRGTYEMPADSIRRFPEHFGTPRENYGAYRRPDFMASSYDNYSAGWGSTHEESLREFNRLGFMAGTFIWTGFDYLGEPTPYEWPARSSYFGVIDLAGFRKDAFYLYQSEWTDRPVLHVLPHWNWASGDTVDVRAYCNRADEVELSVNGRSLGTRRKMPGDLHVQWRVPFEPGVLRAVSRRGGREVLRREVPTAGAPARIVLAADRASLAADSRDLAFVTATIVDAAGNEVPTATNPVQFDVRGAGYLRATDNGSPISHESFQSAVRPAFAGRCLGIVQAAGAGTITVRASAPGLEPASLTLKVGN